MFFEVGKSVLDNSLILEKTADACRPENVLTHPRESGKSYPVPDISCFASAVVIPLINNGSKERDIGRHFSP